MMFNPYDEPRPDTERRTRGSRGGRRGSRNRDSKETHGKSITAAALESAPASEYFENVETVATHLIPRRSLTHQQGLAVKPVELETAPMHGLQLVWYQIGLERGRKWKKVANGRLTKVEAGRVYVTDGEMTDVTNNRLVWKSDKSLLNRSNPFPSINPAPGKERRPQFKRITARTKERITENEQPEIVTPTTPDDDGLGIYI